MHPSNIDTNLQNPTSYRELSRVLLRNWISITSPHEFVLLSFIFDRTIGWCKEWETISWEQFMHGVHGDGGICYNKGTNMPRSTLAKMLKALQKDWFVLTRPGYSGANMYALDYNRKPSERDMFRTSKENPVPGEESAPKFRVSRRGNAARTNTNNDHNASISPINNGNNDFQWSAAETKNRSTKEILKSTTEIRWSTNETLRDSESKEVTPNKETYVMPNPADSGESLTGSLKDSSINADSRIARILQSETVSKVEMAHLFHMSWRVFFAGAPYVAPKEKDIMAMLGAMRKYRNNPNNQMPFTQFFHWCIEHWRVIMSESFYWMSSAPALPSMLFFVKHSQTFEETFARREELKARANMTPKERRLYDLQRQLGMDYQRALTQVEQEFAPREVPPPIYVPQRPIQIPPKYIPPKPIDFDVSKIDYDSLSRL